MGFVTAPCAFSLRMASRAPASDASGPSVLPAFGLLSRPDHAALPSGETWSTRAFSARAAKLASRSHSAKATVAICGFVPILIFVPLVLTDSKDAAAHEHDEIGG